MWWKTWGSSLYTGIGQRGEQLALALIANMLIRLSYANTSKACPLKIKSVLSQNYWLNINSTEVLLKPLPLTAVRIVKPKSASLA